MVCLERPDSALAASGQLPWGALSFRQEFPPLSFRLTFLADCSSKNPGQFSALRRRPTKPSNPDFLYSIKVDRL